MCNIPASCSERAEFHKLCTRWMLSVNKVSLLHLLTLPLLHECLVNGSLACVEMMASAFVFLKVTMVTGTRQCCISTHWLSNPAPVRRSHPQHSCAAGSDTCTSPSKRIKEWIWLATYINFKGYLLCLTPQLVQQNTGPFPTCLKLVMANWRVALVSSAKSLAVYTVAVWIKWIQ